MALHDCIFDYYEHKSHPPKEIFVRTRRRRSRQQGSRHSRPATQTVASSLMNKLRTFSVWRKTSSQLKPSSLASLQPSETDRCLSVNEDTSFCETLTDAAPEPQLIVSRKCASLRLQSDAGNFVAPNTWYYSSDHVLVNQARSKHGIRPLRRSTALDELAREIVTKSAATGTCGTICPSFYQGHVVRGASIRDIHKQTLDMGGSRERRNILSEEFQEFGIATCKGEDGHLYLCQLFDAKTRADF